MKDLKLRLYVVAFVAGREIDDSFRLVQVVVSAPDELIAIAGVMQSTAARDPEITRVLCEPSVICLSDIADGHFTAEPGFVREPTARN